MAVEYETLVQGGHSKFAEEIFKKVKDKTLIDEVKGTDSVPYHFRQTPYGDRLKEKIVGGTVAWNQLIKNGNFADGTTGWDARGAVVSVSGNTALVTVSSAGTERGLKVSDSSAFQFTAVVGHKYIISAEVNSPITAELLCAFSGINGKRVQMTANTWTRCQAIYESPTTIGQVTLYIRQALSQDDVIQYKNVNCFDLTQMFGTTIADYIYSLEQTTAGAGVALFRQLFNKDYYPYDAGSLQSVIGLQSHDEVGFNQWDEEWENGTYNVSTGEKANDNSKIRSKNAVSILPNTTYYVGAIGRSGDAAYVNILFYDGDDSFITKVAYAQNTFVTPNNAKKLRIYMNSAYGTTYNHDICVNISDASKNGTYEPYVKHSYPLDSSLTLRGVPKLVDNKIKFDGDAYESDGKVTRRYGVVDLGTLSWSYHASTSTTDTNRFASYVSSALDAGKKFAATEIANIKTSTYITDTNINTVTGGNTKTGYISMYVENTSGHNFIVINDTRYSDAATFKTAMSGVMLVYEKATPTVTEAQPYTNPQRCAEGGTEEYVTTGIVPVGHESTYVTNKAERFDALPDTASLDGDYIVRQENGVMELVDAEESSKLVESESGNPVTIITDSAQLAKNTHLAFEPIQDLHGYDHPWPAGGGKNLLPLTVENVKSRNTDGTWNGNAYTYRGITFTLNANEDGGITSIVANGTAGNNNANLYLYPATQSQNFPFGGMILSGGVSGSAYIQIELVNSPYTSYAKTTGSDSIIDSAVSQQGTASVNMFARVVSGETVSNAVFKPMIRLASVSDATFEPYSNICPISGLDEVEVKRTGFNIWGEEWEVGAFNSNTGEKIAYANCIRSKNYISVLPSHEYYFKSAGKQITIYSYDKDKNYLGATYRNDNTSTLSANTHYLMFEMANAYGATYNHDICINISDPDKNGTYEPYKGQTVTESLPETVYGGTLDLETGELVVDMFNYVYDGTETFSKSTTALNGFYNSLAAGYIPHSWPYMMDYHGISQIIKEKSNMFIISQNTGTYRNNYGVCYLDSGMNFNVDPDIFGTTTESFKAKLTELYQTGTPVSVAVKLATPLTYTLTPKQLSLLKGTNHISTNAKSVKVTYRNGKLALMDDIPQQLAIEEKKTDEKINSRVDAKFIEVFNDISDEVQAAQTAAQSAQTAKTGAETAKTNAQVAATTATTKASEASQSATNAAQSATDASDSAAAAAQSAQEAREVSPEGIAEFVDDVQDLKSAFGDITETFYGKNRFNVNDRIDGYVLLEDGTLYPTSGWSVSNYCYVGDYEAIMCSALNAQNARNAFSLAYACTYNSNKTFIERIGTLVTPPVSIGNNVKYIRFCYQNTNIDKDIMLEGGSVITNYVPYSETLCVKTDKTLTSEYLPVNAKAVNEKIQDIKDIINYESVTLTLTGSKYLNPITGEITSGGSDNNKVSDYIAVNPNGRVMITTEHFWSQGMYAFYDENKTFITGTAANTGGTVTVIYNKIVNVPANAHYLVIGFLYQASMPAPYVFIGVMQSGKLSEIWKGKKWVCIGDSLTEYNGKTSMHYFDFVAGATGIGIVNMGVSGSGYAKLTDNFMTRVLNVPTDADVVTIFGSGNDSSAGLDLGTASDTGTTTLGGVINTTLDNLFSIMPVCNVGLVTPTPWQGNMPSDNGWMARYSALIVEICNRRSIPCLDLFHCSNLNPNSAEVRQIAYARDGGGGVHPSEVGHAIIAPRFLTFLESLLMH